MTGPAPEPSSDLRHASRPVGAGEQADQTVQRLIELDADHEERATALQKLANRVTAALGRPAALTVVLLVVIGWMGGNYAAARLGFRALEQFPFPDLAFVATIAALLIALLILSAQRHDQSLADKRAQLTLQIAMLNDRKLAKLIELTEEQRRDNPLLPSRPDPEADALTDTVDPLASLDKIERSRPDDD